MAAILLSGVGGSTNRLPLIYPLMALLLVGKGVDLLVHFIRTRSMHHADHGINGVDIQDGAEHGLDNQS